MNDDLTGATQETTSQPLPVLMGRVLADVPAVGKNSSAPANMGGYAFRGIEDVLAALKPAMARHGVFCIPDVIERLATERPLGSGKVMFVVDLCIRWTFYGPLGDTLTSTCWGQGTDMGDKATQKAMTSAFKSMLMQTFAIGDSASDSERHDVPETQGHATTDDDDERWFRENGWKGRDEHHGWKASRIQALKNEAKDNPEGQPAIKKWLKENGLDMSGFVVKALADRFDAFMAALPAEKPAEAPQKSETAYGRTHPTSDAGRTCDGCEQAISANGDCGCPF